MRYSCQYSGQSVKRLKEAPSSLLEEFANCLLIDEYLSENIMEVPTMVLEIIPFPRSKSPRTRKAYVVVVSKIVATNRRASEACLFKFIQDPRLLAKRFDPKMAI